MKSLIAAAVVAVAVAAVASPAQAGRNKVANPGGAPVLGPAVSGRPALRTFPRRLSGVDLHRADRLSHRIKAEFAGAVAARVKLCVAPNGAVTEAGVVGSSGLGAFDKIVLDAARGWRYQTYAAPTGTRLCNVVSVNYRAP